MGVLRDWDDGTVFAEDLIGREGAKMSERDQALLRTLVFGVLRNLTLLDHWIGVLREGSVDRQTGWVLRMGLYQILMMRTPDHAAVNETVELARKSGRGLVNAVLRRAVRERDALLAGAEGSDWPVKYSMPGFLVERWRKTFGEVEAEKLCRWAQEPAPVYLRMNRLKQESAQAFADAEGLVAAGAEDFYLADPVPRSLLDAGVAYAQDPSTVKACELLGVKPGNLVLDACASPGGKTAVLAQLMGNEGRIVATEPSGRRMGRLQENLMRLGVKNAACFRWTWGEETAEGEVRAVPPFGNKGFDRVLVDVPCSNTGVLRRRVDARWRLHEGSFLEMQKKQVAIVSDCMKQVRAGGSLVYSTCSLEDEENRGTVEKALEQAPGWKLVEEEVTLPFRDGFDGAYAALLRKG